MSEEEPVAFHLSPGGTWRPFEKEELRTSRAADAGETQGTGCQMCPGTLQTLFRDYIFLAETQPTALASTPQRCR